jgi:AcrR family transcriptional regulator
MDSSTRERLLVTAATLFAEHGYRGASVRRICDLARANPGAVSYHFGGKKQLYRTVLRRAAGVLADLSIADTETDDDAPPLSLPEAVNRIFLRLIEQPDETRLLLRDLADGGDVAVEALEPTLRFALENLRQAIGEDAAPPGSAPGRELLLDLAAPAFLLTAAWPVLQRALDLGPDDRGRLLDRSSRRTLEAHGIDEGAGGDVAR